MEIERYEIGAMRTNCYLIKDTDTDLAALVDPGAVSNRVDEAIEECAGVKYILLTHGHFDHISKALRYKEITGAQIVIGSHESEFTKNNDLNLSSMFRRGKIQGFDADVTIQDGDIIELGSLKINSIFTPGHTRGGVCYIIDNVIFTGDTLMKNDIGRSDLATGNYDDLIKSIKRLKKLEGDYVVYPGHGEITTLENERKYNEYMQ